MLIKHTFKALCFTQNHHKRTFCMLCGLFYKDTVEEFDGTDLIATGKNLGLKKRFDHVKEGKIFDMCGILHTDLGTQPQLLISGTMIRVRLLKAKDKFTLLAKSGNYRLQIENISLFIRKCDVSSSVLVGHEKALEQLLVQITFTRIKTKTFTLSSGLKSVVIPNTVNGILPSRMILGLVSNSTFNGPFQTNPFNFKSYNLSYISLSENGVQIPQCQLTLLLLKIICLHEII
ncbi:uncharacterized protein TNIN_320971 [Trichonephila inaurata madagascariensis]|uniref:Uncharacterized protein n=1 Tax=Trichonephila inaurata madagascariensis TaxID=2747483 RepID=A0A8X6Y2I4_9ARAC|nr:uncharacterized protein TNIN_320971 [Trichonephila inaurata madagascariensis]